MAVSADGPAMVQLASPGTGHCGHPGGSTGGSPTDALVHVPPWRRCASLLHCVVDQLLKDSARQKMRLIGFTGRKGSGKDTAADVLVGLGYERHAFADPLKATVGALFGLTHEQLHGSLKETVVDPWGYTPRELLQVFGTDIVRDSLATHFPRIDGANFWVDHFRHWYAHQKSSDFVVVPDVRFPNEAAAIKELGGTVFRVVRPGLVTDEFSGHASEIAMDEWHVDGVLNNTGSVEQLHDAMYHKWMQLASE